MRNRFFEENFITRDTFYVFQTVKGTIFHFFSVFKPFILHFCMLEYHLRTPANGAKVEKIDFKWAKLSVLDLFYEGLTEKKKYYQRYEKCEKTLLKQH